jgi:hypothetical protein
MRKVKGRGNNSEAAGLCGIRLLDEEPLLAARVFCAKAALISRFISPLQPAPNDSRGLAPAAEKALARALFCGHISRRSRLLLSRERP